MFVAAHQTSVIIAKPMSDLRRCEGRLPVATEAALPAPRHPLPFNLDVRSRSGKPGSTSEDKSILGDLRAPSLHAVKMTFRDSGTSAFPEV
jgi:hypothetical protein